MISQQIILLHCFVINCALCSAPQALHVRFRCPISSSRYTIYLNTFITAMKIYTLSEELIHTVEKLQKKVALERVQSHSSAHTSQIELSSSIFHTTPIDTLFFFDFLFHTRFERARTKREKDGRRNVRTRAMLSLILTYFPAILHHTDTSNSPELE